MLPGNPYGQIDSSGNEVACGNTPHQYDIIGFVALRLIEVYDPKDPAVQARVAHARSHSRSPRSRLAALRPVTLSTFGSANGCFTGAPDAYTNITLTKVKKQDPGPDPALNQDYTIDASDPKNPVVTWVTSGPANENQTYTLSFDWQKGGRVRDSALGQQLGPLLDRRGRRRADRGNEPWRWRDPNSNLRAVKLCDPAVTGSCAPVTVPT